MKAYEIVAYNTSICPDWETAQKADRVARVGRISAGDRDPVTTLESMTDCTRRMLRMLGSPTSIAFGVRDAHDKIASLPAVLEVLQQTGASLTAALSAVRDHAFDLDKPVYTFDTQKGINHSAFDLDSCAALQRPVPGM